MIDAKKLAVIAAVLFALTAVTVGVHGWWQEREGALTDQIATLEAGIKARDGQIRARDTRIALLVAHDSDVAREITANRGVLTVAKNDAAAARAALEAEAATHAGLVPIAAVHVVEAKLDSVVAACELQSARKDDRIATLIAEGRLKDTTRAQLDTSRAASDTVLKATVAVLKPPWVKRALGWVDDHLITGGLFAVGGYLLGRTGKL